MANLLPVNFPTTSQLPAVYDFVDIAQNIGYGTFYGGEANTSGSTSLNLQKNKIASNTIVSSGSGDVSSAWEDLVDLDFDMDFTDSQNIRGKFYISAPLGINTSQTTNAVEARLAAYVKKWDGTTETILGSGATNSILHGTGYTSSIPRSKKMAVEIDIGDSNTHFKKGESLRINLKGQGKCDSSTKTVWVGVGHDPVEREENEESGVPVAEMTISGSTSTLMQVNIPFQLEA